MKAESGGVPLLNGDMSGKDGTQVRWSSPEHVVTISMAPSPVACTSVDECRCDYCDTSLEQRSHGRCHTNCGVVEGGARLCVVGDTRGAGEARVVSDLSSCDCPEKKQS